MKIKFELDITDIITDIVNYSNGSDNDKSVEEIREDLQMDLRSSFKQEVLKQLMSKINIKSIADSLRTELYKEGIHRINTHSDTLFNEVTKKLLIEGVSLEFHRAWKNDFYRTIVAEFKQDPNILQEIIKGLKS